MKRFHAFVGVAAEHSSSQDGKHLMQKSAGLENFPQVQKKEQMRNFTGFFWKTSRNTKNFKNFKKDKKVQVAPAEVSLEMAAPKRFPLPTPPHKACWSRLTNASPRAKALQSCPTVARRLLVLRSQLTLILPAVVSYGGPHHQRRMGCIAFGRKQSVYTFPRNFSKALTNTYFIGIFLKLKKREGLPPASNDRNQMTGTGQARQNLCNSWKTTPRQSFPTLKITQCRWCLPTYILDVNGLLVHQNFSTLVVCEQVLEILCKRMIFLSQHNPLGDCLRIGFGDFNVSFHDSSI